MADTANTPKVILKKKQVPVIVDFCLEESIEFSVKQQTFPETDWEVELKIKDIKTAIFVGMFLRENRFDIEGVDQQRVKKPVAKKADEKAPETSKTEAKEVIEDEKPKASENQAPTLM